MKDRVNDRFAGACLPVLPSFDDKTVKRISPLLVQEITGESSIDYEAVASFIAPGKRIFFIGIGGISMCGLAEFAHHEGVECVGSDLHANARTVYLNTLGIPIVYRHEAKTIDQTEPDLIVYSKAVFDDNPERLRAAQIGIPCVERAIFLGAINRLFSRVINISGTNGKSTCTAMCAMILLEAGIDPTVHLGAELINFETTVRMSKTKPRDLLLSEACEFKRGFFHYEGTATVILNLVHDHIDCFKTHASLVEAFAQYIALQPQGSKLLLPTYDPDIEWLLKQVDELRPGHINELDLIWFGAFDEQTPYGGASDYSYKHLHYNQRGEPCCDVFRHGKFYTDITLTIPGEFNIRNAMGAIAAADLAGACPSAAKTALRDFRGAEGRFTRVGDYKGAEVIIDYAHHPSAVRVTVEAVRHLPAKRLWICFQPLTHSRVRGFFDEFVDSLLDVRPIMMSEIYDDREKDTSISSKDICDRINELGGEAEFYPTNAALEAHLRAILEPGDVLLIMGVDLRDVGDRLTGRIDHVKRN
ncbi:MAG TPA: Mur ligase domain-containing protein [Clostridia bacterium]|nr:Mur ligase domain-containing protein [Clostridia bacterium]